ncbi:MAG: secretin N-terminal domain-containing protein [Pirellulales bacterium]
MLPLMQKRPYWTAIFTCAGLAICLLATLFFVETAPAQAPAAPAALPAPAADGEPVLKAYEVPGQDPTVVAARLQTQLPGDAGISVASDKRTGRVLVLATPSAHQLVAKLLGPPAPAAAPATNAEPTKRVEKAYTLKNVDAVNFETALVDLAGRKLPVSVDANNRQAIYTLTGRDGATTILSVDRTNGALAISGNDAGVEGWLRVVAALDRPAKRNGDDLEEVVPIRNPAAVNNGSIQQAMRLISEQVGPRNVRDTPANQLVGMLFQPPAAPPATPAPATPADNVASGTALSGPVQIQYIEAFDLLIIRGNAKDVERVKAIIADIERESAFSIPKIEIYPLKNVGSDAMANLIRPLYDQVLSPRQGRVSVTSLVKPNALLLIGREDSIKVVIDLIQRLDQPVDPATEYKVFQLKHTAATEVLQTVQAFLSGQTVGNTGTTPGINQGTLARRSPRRDSVRGPS